MSSQENSAGKKGGLPPDDLSRHLTVANPDSHQSPHVSVVGDTYTILVTGEDTEGRFCLIDMFVPPGGGPPPHRHDFDEMFTIVEGEIDVTFRGEEETASAGTSVNIPANAPHSFKNNGDKPARLLCYCSPAGEDAFFLEVGDKVDSRTAPPPDLTEDEQQERAELAKKLAPKYRQEILA